MNGNSRTASLRLHLVDAVSGPAKGLRESLLSTERSIEKLGRTGAPGVQRLINDLKKAKEAAGAIQGFRDAKRQVGEMSDAFRRARLTVADLKRQFAERPSPALKRELEMAQAELHQTASAFRSQINAADAAASSLKRYGASVRTLRADAAKAEAEIKRLENQLRNPPGLPPSAPPVAIGGEEPKGKNKPQPRRPGMLSTVSGKAVGLVGAYVGVTGAASAGAGAVVDYAALDRRMTRLLVNADADMERRKDVMRRVEKVAQHTGLPVGDVLSGLETLVASGRTIDQSMSMLPSVAVTAQAAGASVEDTAKTGDVMMGSMGINELGLQGGYDRLVSGGKVGKFEFKDMAQYLPSILPQAATLGYRGNEGVARISAALQVVRQQTGDSSTAATNLENVFGKLYMEETTKNFKDFGIDLPRALDRARENGRDPLTTVMDLTEQALGGDLSRLPLLFGDMQAQAGIRALIQGRDDLEKFTAQLSNVDGSTMTDLGKVVDDTTSKIERAGNAWEKFKTQVGEGIAEYSNPVLDFLTSAADKAGDVQKAIQGQDEATRNRNRREFYRRYQRANPGASSWTIGQAYGDALARQGRGEGDLMDGLPQVSEVIARPLPQSVLDALERSAALRNSGQHLEGGFHRAGVQGMPPMPPVYAAPAVPAGEKSAPSVNKVNSENVVNVTNHNSFNITGADPKAIAAQIGGILDGQISRLQRTSLSGGDRRD